MALVCLKSMDTVYERHKIVPINFTGHHIAMPTDSADLMHNARCFLLMHITGLVGVLVKIVEMF
jgi:hypothetical protein